MIEFVDEKIKLFCKEHGVFDDMSFIQIRAGRNSEVHKITSQYGQWILKKYFYDSSDNRDRLRTEFGFLSYLKNLKIPMVARPLGMNQELQCALYSFLKGERVASISSEHILQAADFIRTINKASNRPDAMSLPLAADACLCWQDHLNLVDSRIDRLLKLLPELELEKEAQQFVRDKLLPKWLQLKNLVESAMLQFDKEISIGFKIISPSDFGFHNALENHGQLFFLDFEYSGWDDPVKLICDFICQPEVLVNQTQGQQFIDEVLSDLPNPDKIKFLVQLLLPIHRLKWCCILLNEFRLEDRFRRIHAGVASEGLLADQLSKAKCYFNSHLA